MATSKFTAFALLAALGLPVSADGRDTFTLYRNTEANQNDRIHIATFDSDGGFRYNMESCHLAAALFQLQPRVYTVFWCERGVYRR